jgi:hypothetical protein
VPVSSRTRARRLRRGGIVGVIALLAVASVAWACEPNPAVSPPSLGTLGGFDCTGEAYHEASQIGLLRYDMEHAIELNCSNAKTVDGRHATVVIDYCGSTLYDYLGPGVMQESGPCEVTFAGYKATNTLQDKTSIHRFKWGFSVMLRLTAPVDAYWANSNWCNGNFGKTITCHHTDTDETVGLDRVYQLR